MIIALVSNYIVPENYGLYQLLYNKFLALKSRVKDNVLNRILKNFKLREHDDLIIIPSGDEEESRLENSIEEDQEQSHEIT